MSKLKMMRKQGFKGSKCFKCSLNPWDLERCNAPPSEYHDSHYANDSIQPIEIMQATMTPEQFQGFLLGNIIKYTCRCGKKTSEPVQKELDKIRRYRQWLEQALRGEMIDPREVQMKKYS